MKAALIALTVLITSTGVAQRLPEYATSGRLLTIEQWTRHQAVVWALLKGQIVVYRTFDTLQPDELVAQVPISPEQEDRVLREVRSISRDIWGTLTWDRNLLHGPLLRVYRESDGVFTADRIEICRVQTPLLRELCEAVSSAIGDGPKITFHEEVELMAKRDIELWGSAHLAFTDPLSAYYGEEPNQAHQRNAGDRPPADDTPASDTPSSPAPRD